jgi:hypothetical protein
MTRLAAEWKHVFVRRDESGPTLIVESRELSFSEPVDGAWASDHFGGVGDFQAP